MRPSDRWGDPNDPVTQWQPGVHRVARSDWRQFGGDPSEPFKVRALRAAGRAGPVPGPESLLDEGVHRDVGPRDDVVRGRRRGVVVEGEVDDLAVLQLVELLAGRRVVDLLEQPRFRADAPGFTKASNSLYGLSSNWKPPRSVGVEPGDGTAMRLKPRGPDHVPCRSLNRRAALESGAATGHVPRRNSTQRSRWDHAEQEGPQTPIPPGSSGPWHGRVECRVSAGTGQRTRGGGPVGRCGQGGGGRPPRCPWSPAQATPAIRRRSGTVTVPEVVNGGPGVQAGVALR